MTLNDEVCTSLALLRVWLCQTACLLCPGAKRCLYYTLLDVRTVRQSLQYAQTELGASDQKLEAWERG